MRSGDHDVYLHFDRLATALQRAIPPEGGFFTIAALVARLDRAEAFPARTPANAKPNLVRRLLEVSEAAKLKRARSVPAFIGYDPQTGKIVHPRRPKGIEPVHDEVGFEPRRLK